MTVVLRSGSLGSLPRMLLVARVLWIELWFSGVQGCCWVIGGLFLNVQECQAGPGTDRKACLRSCPSGIISTWGKDSGQTRPHDHAKTLADIYLAGHLMGCRTESRMGQHCTCHFTELDLP